MTDGNLNPQVQNGSVVDDSNTSYGAMDGRGVGQQAVSDDVSSQQPQSIKPTPESAPVSTGMSNEVVPVVEVKEYEIPAEVSEYVEKVEKENAELERKVVHEGQPVVEPMMSVEEPSVVLPITKQGLTVAVTKKVTTSARWLGEWCLRIIKKFKGRVFYTPNSE